MVPFAAAVGLSLTPSKHIVARVAGGVVLASAANMVRQAVVAAKKRKAPEALLEFVRVEGSDKVTRQQVGLDVACSTRLVPFSLEGRWVRRSIRLCSAEHEEI